MNTSPSEKNRADLEKVYKEKGVKDIKFFIAPDSTVSPDECVVAVRKTLEMDFSTLTPSFPKMDD